MPGGNSSASNRSSSTIWWDFRNRLGRIPGLQARQKVKWGAEVSDKADMEATDSTLGAQSQHRLGMQSMLCRTVPLLSVQILCRRCGK